MEDPIIEEVRKARQEHAKQFNHDLSEICKNLKKSKKMWLQDGFTASQTAHNGSPTSFFGA